MSDSGRGENGARGPAEQSFSDAFADAARRSALGHVRPGEAPTGRALLGAMGGVRGLVESIVPGVGFLLVYTIGRAAGLPAPLLVPVSVAVPGALGLLFVAARLIQRQPVTLAVAGLFGLLVSAILAIVTGRASNNFLLGFGIDLALALVMIVSIAARRPLIGLVVGMLAGDASGWRTDRAKRRVALVATILWAAFPLARLVVQVPLYLADLTTALGATKLAMGVPLYAAVVWVTWLLVRSVLTPRPVEADEPAGRE